MYLFIYIFIRWFETKRRKHGRRSPVAKLFYPEVSARTFSPEYATVMRRNDFFQVSSCPSPGFIPTTEQSW